jgi:hypothetical protein
MSTETLLDDRTVADLRARVMADVDADVRRRGRRARIAGGAVAASVVALGLVVGTAAITTNDPSMTVADDASTSEVAPFPQDGSEALVDPSLLIPLPGGDLTSASGDTAAGPSDLDRRDSADGREVIVTGSAALVVDDPTDAATAFGTWVESQGGRVDHRADQDGQTFLTVRVPSVGTSAAIDYLGTLGEVESTSITRSDVTSQIVDLDARIAALQTSIARLTEILNQANTTADVVAAESNLTQRQAELDGLTAQRAALGEQVELSSVDVTFSETPTTASVEPDGFLGGLRTGWNSVVETVNGIVTAAGVAAPWLGIALVLGGGFWIVTRRRRR